MLAAEPDPQVVLLSHSYNSFNFFFSLSSWLWLPEQPISAKTVGYPVSQELMPTAVGGAALVFSTFGFFPYGNEDIILLLPSHPHNL